MGDVDIGGDCACVEAEHLWEISVSSFQFYVNPKTTLKKT